MGLLSSIWAARKWKTPDCELSKIVGAREKNHFAIPSCQPNDSVRPAENWTAFFIP
jgi:hypothetical protein